MSLARVRIPLWSMLLLAGALAPCPAAAAPPPMREIVTRHYRIHTDLDFELANDLAQRLDAMHEAYSWRLRIFAQQGQEFPRFEVYLYRKQKDYLALTGNKMKHTGGVFMSGRNLLASFLEMQGRDTLRRTLQHEAFHQFAHTVISPNMPVWLNEGLAQVFEEAVWNGSNFSLEQIPPRRIRQLRQDLEERRLIKFETLMALTPNEWARRLEGNHAAGATQYNQAWAMVHFLINAKDENGAFRYRQRLLKMLELLHDGQQADAAFRGAFGSNLAGFEKRFVEYARQLQPTAQATILENQEVIADLLVALRQMGKRFDTIAELREDVARENYRMNYTRGALKWTTADDIAVYFRNANDETFRSDELYFQPRASAPIPDLVCRFSDQLQFRTRFYSEDGKVEHEVVVEPVKRPAPVVGTARE